MVMETVLIIDLSNKLKWPIQWPRNQYVVLRPLASWDWGFESGWADGYLSLVSVVCYQVNWSLVQRNPTECCVFECDHEEASTSKKSWPTWACRSHKKK